MTTRDFNYLVIDDLDEGYSVNMVSRAGFKMQVSGAGEGMYVAHGIDGCRFARTSETFDYKSLKGFVMRNGFELF